VRLPLPCPAQLVELSHYRGDRRWIALWSSAAGDELVVSDGVFTVTARLHGWSCFCAHPLVGVFLEPYRLGQTNDQGEHRLLVDRYLADLHVGLAEDVDQLLAVQPSDLAADAEQLLPGVVTAVAFSPDGATLATASHDRSARSGLYVNQLRKSAVKRGFSAPPTPASGRQSSPSSPATRSAPATPPPPRPAHLTG
jgi:WD40 repeat protein